MAETREGKPSKTVQAWRDLLSELYSWLRWFFLYLFPRGLSFPFQFPAVVTLYFLALLALGVVFLPTGALQRFIQELIVDLWKRLAGENSAAALATLLQSFPPGWVFFSILILAAWGLIVLFWAWKQHTFFKAIEDAGIRIVRGPGRRTAFFNRLQAGGVSAIGLGPTARLLPVYVPRKEDLLLRERMHSYLQKRSNFGILITGIATSGKTRTAMELIADLKPAFVLVWPRISFILNSSNLR